MPAAVRCMADCAVFLDRWMLIDKGSAFVSVTLVAELVDVFRLDHGVRSFAAMGVMAVAALDFTFSYRMMGPFVDLASFGFVTVEADRRLINRHLRRVDRMARGAGDVVSAVGADVPGAQHCSGGMAPQALFVEFCSCTAAIFTV